MTALTDLLGIKVYRSEAVARGKIVVLGGGKKPDNWNNMTREEQLRWVGRHAIALAIHPLDPQP